MKLQSFNVSIKGRQEQVVIGAPSLAIVARFCLKRGWALDAPIGSSSVPPDTQEGADIVLDAAGDIVAQWYTNLYECADCGEGWEDRWDCCCDDECPSCGVDYTPKESIPDLS